MSHDIASLTRCYARRGILVDTNLLLLLFIGEFDQDLIAKFKRTRQFTLEDYHTLANYLKNFNLWVTTPNVLTEVSNLVGSLGGRCSEFFEAVFSKNISVLQEQYIPSNLVAETSHFAKLGLTDTAIISLVKGKYLLLTDDFRLSQYFQKMRGDVVNFNHIRMWSM